MNHKIGGSNFSVVNTSGEEANPYSSASQTFNTVTSIYLDLASLKNNFTEQLTDDEDGDSTPFSRESVNDAKLNIQHVQDISKAHSSIKNENNHTNIKKANLWQPKEPSSVYGTGFKLRAKFYRPYRIKTVKADDRYEVEKVGQQEGPNLTSTAVDFM
ncbi:hypothetical protein TNIN_303581 [Trichonephila inaurata madagascariensis]|uniref:Uncharacterized protein n=1 Tax=Trichonephila inaurata madagascariensis TaxID=2747483 RepID=A0A8X6XQ77_9ARAC|nr:hypothetical protein TNIN_303581 [Trichonephila inaurata madagascariensis]